MGGHQSKDESTDWEAANAGLKDPKLTLDRSEPTDKVTEITLVKKGVANARESTIKDENGKDTYKTEVTSGTSKWFHLIKFNEDGSDGTTLAIQRTGMGSFIWNVFTTTPNFEGQEADEKAASSEKSDKPFYRCVQIHFPWNEHAAYVYRFAKTSNDALGETNHKNDVPIMIVEFVKSMKLTFQCLLKKGNKELVSFMKWQDIGSHEMKIKMAKGSDVALNCIVALAATMVQNDKAAGGAAAAGAC